MKRIEIYSKYYTHEVKEYSKGKDRKGYKIKVTFNETRNRREYLDELCELDRAECGLFLCKVEYTELTEDRWWDIPSYREQHLASYRRTILRYKKEYGLTNKQVSEFLKVK